MAASLRANHAHRVAVTDLKQERRDEARADGFQVLDFPPGIQVKGFSVVVGCSGDRDADAPLNHPALRSLDHHAIIVNATSKRSEVNYTHLTNLTISTTRQLGFGTEVVLTNDSCITLLANGFPVNFFDDSESVTDSAIQFIPALILGCAGFLTQRVLPPIVHPVPLRLQREIEEVHNSETRR